MTTCPGSASCINAGDFTQGNHSRQFNACIVSNKTATHSLLWLSLRAPTLQVVLLSTTTRLLMVDATNIIQNVSTFEKDLVMRKLVA
jgi:hypothetical protein